MNFYMQALHTYVHTTQWKWIRNGVLRVAFFHFTFELQNWTWCCAVRYPFEFYMQAHPSIQCTLLYVYSCIWCRCCCRCYSCNCSPSSFIICTHKFILYEWRTWWKCGCCYTQYENLYKLYFTEVEGLLGGVVVGDWGR